MGMFDIFKDNLSNPAVTIGSTLLKSAQEGRALVADKKRKEEEAAAEYELFLKKEDVKIEKQLEKEEKAREAKRLFDKNNFSIIAQEKGVGEAIVEAEKFKAKNLQNKEVSWSDTPVSITDIEDRNKIIQDVVPKVLALGNYTYTKNNATISIDNPAGLKSALDNGDVSLADLLSKTRNAEIAQKKIEKQTPTFSEKKEAEEAAARVGTIQQQFPDSSIREAQKIIDFLDQDLRVIDLNKNIVTNSATRAAVKKYNSNNLQNITEDNSFIVLPSLMSKEYLDAKTVDKEQFIKSYILDYAKLDDDIFGAIASDNPAQAEQIKQDLRVMLPELWKMAGGMKFNEKGASELDTNFSYDWKELWPVPLEQLPTWYKGVLTDSIDIFIPKELQKEGSMQLEETTNMETGGKEVTISYKPINIRQEDIQQVYPNTVYNNMGKNPPSMDEYKIHSIVAHSNKYGLQLYDYGIQLDNQDNLILGATPTEFQAKNRKSAFGIMGKAQRVSHYGAKLYTPLFYDLAAGGAVRQIKMRKEFYDEANFEFLNLASNIEETMPRMGMPVSFDPRNLTKRYISTIAGGIRKTRGGGYLLPEFSGLEQGITAEGTPKTLMRYRNIKTAEQYAKIRGLNIESIRDQAGQSERALDSAYQLYDSLNETGIGAGLLENVILLADGIKGITKSLGGLNNKTSYENTIKEGGYDKRLDSDLLDRIANMDIDDKLKDVLMNSLRVGSGEKSDQSRGLFDNISSRIRGLSTPQKIARQQMLHASLVFYAAAAFQGEGGKAISDADREFVAWALNYGAFSSPAARKASILGMIGIMAKSHAINNGLISSDVATVWAADNYNSVAGNFVDQANRGLALSPESYPKDIREKYNLDRLIGNSSTVTIDVESAEDYRDVPVEDATPMEEGTEFMIGGKSLNFETNPNKGQAYTDSRNKVLNILKSNKVNPSIVVLDEDTINNMKDTYKFTEEELSQ